MDIQDEIEAIRLAKEQRASLTEDENRFLDGQEDRLKMGIRCPLTAAELVMAAAIKVKFDVYRYGGQ